MYFGQNKAPILTVGITEYDHKCHETWTYFIPAGKHTKLGFDSYLKNTKNIDCTDLHCRPELM